MKRLVLCADDFALHDAASSAIAELAERDRLSATSVMVLSPRWPQDAGLLQDLRGRIDVGLHLDWTSDFALQAGHGMRLGRAMRQAWFGGFDRTSAAAEIERQLDCFEQHWQAAPDHVDGHQHVQQFAGIGEALVQVLQRRYGGGTAVPYLRLSRAPAGQADFKSRVIAAMGANRLERLARSAGLPTAPSLSGVHDFTLGAASYAEHMARWLAHSPDACLLMCHPACETVAGDDIGAARLREYQHLGSAAFAEQLQRLGVTLVRGRELYSLPS